MFVLIPLILIASSVGGIGWIVLPKIKKIKVKESLAEAREDIWHLLLPEFFGLWNKIDFQGFRKGTLAEYEKLLRRIRILSLKTDNFVNHLLERRRKRTPKPEFKEYVFSSEPEADSSKNGSNFKTKEISIIAEIAKNPKDKNLYKTLGAFYLENKMPADAKEVFDVVLELDPNDLETKKSIEKIGGLR